MEKRGLEEFKELKLQSVEKALNYKFKNKSRLIQTFTTKSHAKEKKDKKISVESQDSLRTLGDAILKNTLIEILINLGLSTPKDITETKKDLESRKHLAIIFKDMKIPFDCFKKGDGEIENNKLFAETLEAIVAAIYLDLKKDKKRPNISKLEKIIKKWFKKDLNSIKKNISS